MKILRCFAFTIAACTALAGFSFAAESTPAAKAPAAAAATPDISGKWVASFETPMGVMQANLTLKVEGDKVTGTSSNDMMGELKIQEGKINKDTVTWYEDFSMDGGMSFRLTYTGKIAGDEIKLSRTVGDFGTQEAVAKRVKETPAPAPAASAAPAAKK